MLNGSLNKGTVQYRQGTSLAHGVTIDGFLSDADTKTLYQKWKKEWGEPLEYQGGQIAITCEMVRDAPLTALVSAYGKKLSARLLEAAKKGAVL